MTTQSLVTVIVSLQRQLVPPVARALRRFGNLHRGAEPDDARAASQALRDDLDTTGVIHFLSVNIVDEAADDPHTSAAAPPGLAHLVLEMSVDGSGSDALESLAPVVRKHCPELLRALGAPLEPKALARYLKNHRISIGTGPGKALGLTFLGVPGFSVRRIREESDLARRVAGWVGNGSGGSPLAVLEDVRGRLWQNGDKWTLAAEPVPWLSPRPRSATVALLRTVLVALAVLLAVATLDLLFDLNLLGGIGIAVLLMAAGVAAVYAGLRWRESRDDADDVTPDAEHVAAILENENCAAQNHLFAVSTCKPGLVRKLTLRFAFTIIDDLARWSFRPGFLGELGAINFARWVVIPGTGKLVFLSNYSGSWESYLEDFVQRASRGLTGIWSNTVGFPRTRHLFFDGASDGDRFKRWARRQQRPTLLWYSAYPNLTTARIRLNALIRQGIAAVRTEGEAADWLSCFGSAPASPSSLDSTEIPGLVFGGFSPLHHGQALLLKLTGDRAANWLRAIAPSLTYGERRPDLATAATLVAFSRTGLEALGLDRRDLETFPPAFLNGMAHPARARALGDVGADAPGRWTWGSGAKEAGAILLVYAKTADDLEQLVVKRTAELERFGQEIIGCVMFKPLRGQQNITSVAVQKVEDDRGNGDLAREPFGFADGISQPIIRGTRRWTRIRDASHLVEPGEFVLGYPDNGRRIPPSPSVAAARDPDHQLPSFGADPFRERPDFSRPQPTRERDFGRNGTFLVVRQLEQYQDRFDQFLREAAQRLEGHPAVPWDAAAREEWVAAKLVGRWRDGTSLVRFPTHPGTSGGRVARPDNDFLYGRDDPDGRRCPFGAHVRRVNPRDSFPPHGPGELAISNRHRILRVGRVYLPEREGGRNGLFFMCLNADIERQFELVQQTWAKGASFHGLESEVDCFSPRGATDCFTVPTEHGPIYLKRLEDFVRVVGGGYFFMPSRRAVRYLAQQGAEREPARLTHASQEARAAASPS